MGRAERNPIGVNVVRLIHLSPPRDFGVNHILAPAVRQVYRKRCLYSLLNPSGVTELSDNMCPYTPFAPLGLEFGMDRSLYTFRPAGANTKLT